MAIGLGDLAVKKKVPVSKVTEVAPVKPVQLDDRQQQQRPWEAKQQAQKSAVAGIAVKRAKEVVLKNEEMARQLRKSFTSAQKELELEMYIENREKEFLNIDNSKNMINSKERIKTHRSFLKRLRDSLFRS